MKNSVRLSLSWRFGVVLGLTVAVLAGAAGCSHMSYTRGVEDTVSRRSPDEAPPTTYEAELDMNEIVLADRLGIFCSSLAETSEKLGNAKSAHDKAVEEGKRTYTVTWRERNPADYKGVACGAYYKWSGPSGGLENSPAFDADDSPYDVTYGEGGLFFGGTEALVDSWDWLRWSMQVKVGMGQFTFDPDDNYRNVDDDEWSFRTPMDFGLLIYPDFLYGAGVEAFGGMDLIGWAFTSGHGTWTEKFDYGARAGYIFTTDYLALSAYGGWEHRNYAWGEFWTQYDSFGITAAIDLNYEQMFD
jgi:hypothetical protein